MRIRTTRVCWFRSQVRNSVHHQPVAGALVQVGESIAIVIVPFELCLPLFCVRELWIRSRDPYLK